jgi:hypothetical protein
MSLKHTPDDTSLEEIGDRINIIKKFNPDLFKSTEPRYLFPEIVKRYPMDTTFNSGKGSPVVSGSGMNRLINFLERLFVKSHNTDIMVNIMDLVTDLELVDAAYTINKHIEKRGLIRKV